MPIYEYECRACGEELEIIQKISEGPLRKCPACEALKLRRKISRSAFHLKGDGWYVTDYGKNGAQEKSKGSDSESTAKSETKGETKSETKNTEKASSGTGKSETKKASGSKSSD